MSDAWGDDAVSRRPLPDNETIVDEAKNTRTEITYDYHESDPSKILRTTRKFKIIRKTQRVPKAIKQRRNWAKFGAAKEENIGVADPSTTFVSNDEIRLVKGEEHDAEEERKHQELLDRLKNRGAERAMERAMEDVSSKGKGGLFDPKMAAEMAKQESSMGGAPPGGAPGKYLPPGRRAGAVGGGGSDFTPSLEHSTDLRISNISEDATDEDLKLLLRPFGQTSRIYLAKDRETGRSRGFAYVSYHMREDAERCMQGLNGHGYDHLILRVEWAQPSQPRNPGAEGGGLSRGFTSGYGKALPQGR